MRRDRRRPRHVGDAGALITIGLRIMSGQPLDEVAEHFRTVAGNLGCAAKVWVGVGEAGVPVVFVEAAEETLHAVFAVMPEA